ncbi:exodeoxyribonuclease VII large subunit [Edaphobacter flagellatus]|uniref:exodeoxyribonuclease VII large subunit n=1 Tax=Edaphobacter flagellatus TaxID=1933044 RepID=UPI0021B4AB52|nr:exodeoxyribonuclease VII large subunit [Edaphobacter flagellatus]
MSSPEQKPPTLASLRAGRALARSSRNEDTNALQSDLFFPATEPEEPEPPKTAPVKPASVIERHIWTVAALVNRIRLQVESNYADTWVEGEISNCRIAPSGHIYFTLKDAQAQLPVVLFRRQAQLLRFRPADGLAILARGRISVYESRGQLQLIAETLEPRGAGSIQLAFEQLKARLLAEGLFDASRKQPLPAFPRTVGVITSPTGAVIRDIVIVIRRRHAPLNLLVYPAVMQGVSSPSSVAAGIRFFNRNPKHVDIILIARGGGSLEDLACFNDEALARIIAASELPIVSAIGHETDFTIADFVADLRAPTPSAAAEIITAAQHRIEDRVSQLDHRLRRAVRLTLIETRQRYDRLSAVQVLRSVTHSINRRAQRTDELIHRLDRAIERRLRSHSDHLHALIERLRPQEPTLRLATSHRRLEHANLRLDRAASSAFALQRARLQSITTRLEALSPLNVLARGYALVYNADGTLLRSAAETTAGQTIQARLAKGSLAAQVLTTKQHNEA